MLEQVEDSVGEDMDDFNWDAAWLKIQEISSHSHVFLYITVVLACFRQFS